MKKEENSGVPFVATVAGIVIGVFVLVFNIATLFEPAGGAGEHHGGDGKPTHAAPNAHDNPESLVDAESTNHGGHDTQKEHELAGEHGTDESHDKPAAH